MEPLLRQVQALALPKGEYAIFGSGPLIVRGIIQGSNDLDILCRGPAWEQVRSTGTVQYLEDYDVTTVTLCDGRLTFGTKWGIGDFDTDLLIDTAEEIRGLPFVRLEHVVRYKKISQRPKDLEHLDALNAYQSGQISKATGSIVG